MKDTTLSRVSDTRRFFTSEVDRTWFLLAGSTPWPNETSPPAENLDVVSFSDVVLAKKATLRLVVPDVAGDITYYDDNNVLTKYREVSYAAALAERCTRILFNVVVRGNEVPATAAVRIIALTNNLVGSVPGTTLVAGQIISQGEIQAVENRKPLYLNANSTYNLSSILEF
jgi:hypothetical protein